MLVTARLQHTPGAEGLPHLPSELWNMMLGVVKHDALPVLGDDGWEPAEESESEEEGGWDSEEEDGEDEDEGADEEGDDGEEI
jgi:hypothetical protein